MQPFLACMWMMLRRVISYCPGLTFKVNDLSMFKSLIEEKTTIVCEDTKNISFDEAGNQIEYFKSRGVDSFFAVPIMVEDQIEGVLVAEYNYQIDDVSLVESRLNILKIIANILGDARKKILYEERLYNFAFSMKSQSLLTAICL